jgi:hypothetical protein
MPFTGQLATSDSRLANVELGGPVALTAAPSFPRVVFEINFTDNPTLEFPPTGYTDISNRVRAFTTRRGRSNFVDRVEAGTATITLDNRDGYLNPGQPGRMLMRRARLSCVYDHNTYRLLTGHIDSWHYSYPSVDKDAIVEVTVSDGLKVLAQQAFPPTYIREAETVSARLVNALTTAGIGSSYQSVATGYINNQQLAPAAVTPPSPTATKTITATLTPASNTITVSPDVGGLIPNAPITGPGLPVGTLIDAILSSTTFRIRNDTYLNAAYGFAFITRTKDTQYPGNPGPWYEIAAISDTKDLSIGMSVGPYYNDPSVGGVLLFDPSIHKITEIQEGVVKVGQAITNTWRGPSNPGGVATGVPFSAPAAATLTVDKPYLQITNILDHIRQIEQTERGTFLCLGDGTYTYQGSGYRPAQTVQLTFGENTAAGEVPYMESPITNDDALIDNDYLLTNTYTGETLTVSDATSQANYFRHSQQIDMIWYLGSSLALPSAERAFQPIPRMEGLIVNPAVNPPGLWPQLLNLEISRRVSLRRRPLGAADIFASYDQFIESIQHDATPETWQVTYITSPFRT